MICSLFWYQVLALELSFPSFTVNDVVIFSQSRILGTPTNREWEGVEDLPAYKREFPKWSRKDLTKLVPGLDRAGIDLLEVGGNILVMLLILLVILISTTNPLVYKFSRPRYF